MEKNKRPGFCLVNNDTFKAMAKRKVQGGIDRIRGEKGAMEHRQECPSCRGYFARQVQMARRAKEKMEAELKEAAKHMPEKEDTPLTSNEGGGYTGEEIIS